MISFWDSLGCIQAVLTLAHAAMIKAPYVKPSSRVIRIRYQHLCGPCIYYPATWSVYVNDAGMSTFVCIYLHIHTHTDMYT